jgi:hypothetical protein
MILDFFAKNGDKIGVMAQDAAVYAEKMILICISSRKWLFFAEIWRKSFVLINNIDPSRFFKVIFRQICSCFIR